VGGGLGARRLVAGLLGQLVEGADVLQRREGPVELGDRSLELRLLLQQRLGLLVLSPEGRILREPGDLGGAGALPLDVKETPGAPRGGPRCRRGVLRSVTA